MLILGAMGDFAALALTAQSIVAPIGASSLVVNIFFASFWLGETLHNTDVYGCLLIIAGSVTAVLFGSRAEPELTVKDLLSYFCRAPFVIYMVLVGMVVLGCNIALKKIEAYHEAVENAIQAAKDSQPGSTTNALEQLKMNPKFIAAQKEYEPHQKVHPMFYCVLSGSLGGQSLLFAKCVAELVKTSFRGDNQLVNPIFYVFLCFMLFFVLSQVHFLNQALILCDALLVVPIFQCTFLSFSTTGGLIYYQEYLEFGASNWLGLFFGLSLILFGVYTLCHRSFSSIEVEVVEEQGEQSPADRVPSGNSEDMRDSQPRPDEPVALPPAESQQDESPASRRPSHLRLRSGGHQRQSSNLIPVGDPLFIPTLTFKGNFSDIMHCWPDPQTQKKEKSLAQESGSTGPPKVIVPGCSKSMSNMKLYE